MSEKDINRIINRIAEEVSDRREAEAIIKLLDNVDWEDAIMAGKTRRNQRESQRVVRANFNARRENLPATLTNLEWIETLDYFQWRCAYCRTVFSYDDLDHFIPLASKKGGTTAYNCVPACKKCNSKKGGRTIEYWLRQLHIENLEDPFTKDLKRVYEYLSTREKTEQTVGNQSVQRLIPEEQQKDSQKNYV